MARSKSTKAKRAKASPLSLDDHYQKYVKQELSGCPWVLRVTDHKNKPAPVFIVKQRLLPDEREDAGGLTAPRSVLKERGLLAGTSQRLCLPILRTILARVQNGAGIPLELHHYLEGTRIVFRGNLPLDEEAGYKLALVFKLQERIQHPDRIELLARRIDRFTREEVGYWFSRMTHFGDAANRWAAAGMKIMLAGQPGDPGIETLLNHLRASYE